MVIGVTCSSTISDGAVLASVRAVPTCMVCVPLDIGVSCTGGASNMSYNTYSNLKARRAVLTEMLLEDGFLSDDLTRELYNIQGELNKDLTLV